MRKALFIVGSFSAINPCGKKSLILEKINGISVIERIIRNIENASFDYKFFVASDSEEDEAIIETVKSVEKSGFDIIRIPSDSKFAISNSNVFIDDFFVYYEPHHSVFNIECLLDFSKKFDFEYAVVLYADQCPLINSNILEEFYLATSAKANYLDFGLPCVPIAGGPIEELKTLYYQSKTEVKNRIEKLEKFIDAEADKIKKDFGIDADRNRKKSRMREMAGKPIRCVDAIKFRDARDGVNHEEFMKNFIGKEIYFYPAFTKENIDFLSVFDEIYSNLDLETFEEKRKLLKAKSGNLLPGYVEIEASSKCSLNCSYCPNTIMKRKKGDMPLEVFKKVLKAFGKSHFFCFSGWGEPLENKNIVEFVKLAKEKGVLRVALETSGVLLSEDLFSQLQEAGLDVLILNVDALYGNMGKEKANSFLTNLFSRKRDSVYIVLQLINDVYKRNFIEMIYGIWQYIADRIVLLPFNDCYGKFSLEGAIDFTPKKMKNEICRKTNFSVYINSEGGIPLCKQLFDEEGEKENYYEAWYHRRSFGLKKDFCKSCRIWYQLDIPPASYYGKKALKEIDNLLFDYVDEAISKFKNEKAPDASKIRKMLRYKPDFNSEGFF